MSKNENPKKLLEKNLQLSTTYEAKKEGLKSPKNR
jgi:hypothetical protein